MAVFNLGSINADLFYQVPHLLAPGETLASTDHSRGLGGKGASRLVLICICDCLSIVVTVEIQEGLALDGTCGERVPGRQAAKRAAPKQIILTDETP